MYTRIVSTGHYLPEKVLTNQQLESMMETSDEWIRSRTGIVTRHIAADGESTSSMAEQAARRALQAADLPATALDMIIMGTTTPDQVFPNSAVLVQDRLGAYGIPAFTVEAACSGFIYALSAADKFIRTGVAHRVLVIGAEKISPLVDWTDRGTAIIFGDGAGAVIVEANEQPGILSTHLGSDGKYKDLLYFPSGPGKNFERMGQDSIQMIGSEVFKVAVTTLSDVAEQALSRQEIDKAELDWLIPHQANLRIIQAVAKRLGVSMERVVVTVDRHGNTSAASIPLALDVAVRDGRIKRGQLVLLEAFGGGFTWGSVLLRF